MVIKSDDIIKVPYEQFELMMIACYFQNGCDEHPDNCRCRKLSNQQVTKRLEDSG